MLIWLAFWRAIGTFGSALAGICGVLFLILMDFAEHDSSRETVMYAGFLLIMGILIGIPVAVIGGIGWSICRILTR